MPVSASLPAPAGEAREHGERVRAHLHAAIADAGGWLDFERFMSLALYAPGLGYYSAGATKLGAGGDFVTAPELGPLFAQSLARALAPVLAECPDAGIVEFGAGTGALAAELLPALAALGIAVPDYAILETSAALKARQQARIDALPRDQASRVRWLDRLPPAAPAGIVIANEVLDALPVQRFRVETDGVRPLGVVRDGDGFAWRTGDADAALAREVETRLGPALATLPAGYESELCMLMPAWVASALALFDSGVALFVDYGLPRREYYAPERCGGTLRCHYRHHAHSDPFLVPGLQDITAWVDFTTVAEAAVATGWEVAGFATQAHWLLDCGVLEVAAAPAADARAEAERARELRMLTMPGEMGERFRVMALSRGVETVPPGFGLRDLRDRL